MSNLRSPNEMLEAAIEIMLEGRQPDSDLDWVLIVNFFAANIHRDVVSSAMPILKAIYDIPLSDELIAQIIEFQTQRE